MKKFITLATLAVSLNATSAQATCGGCGGWVNISSGATAEASGVYTATQAFTAYDVNAWGGGPSQNGGGAGFDGNFAGGAAAFGEGPGNSWTNVGAGFNAQWGFGNPQQ